MVKVLRAKVYCFQLPAGSDKMPNCFATDSGGKASIIYGKFFKSRILRKSFNMQEQELFQSYEVKNWDFSPRIYKILAVSAIFNILALMIIGQTSLLTTKGCDSPLVGGVCQVIDTLYVGGTVLTTPAETAEAPYEQTTISPDDEIVWIPLQEDPFKYPSGYYATSNPLAVNDVPQEIPDPNGFPSYIPGMNPTTNPK